MATRAFGIVIVVLAGCGSSPGGGIDSGPGDSGATAKAAYQQYSDDLNRAQCERRQRCTQPPPYASVDACLAAIDPKLTLTRTRIADSIEGGRTSWSASAARACLALYAGACSTSETTILTECNKVIDGLRSTGVSCVGHFECIGADLCFAGCTAVQGNEATVVTGACVARSPIGTPACP